MINKQTVKIEKAEIKIIYLIIYFYRKEVKEKKLMKLNLIEIK